MAALLSISFLIRLFLFSQEGFTGDINDFTCWFQTAASSGIRSFYIVVVPPCDYPPFNVYIFWMSGNLANAVARFGISITDVIKLVPTLFDMATGLLIYVFVRKQASFKLALVAAALYIFNPAVIYDSAVWGQIDAIYTFFMILALMLALKSRPKLAMAVYAIAILTKPQSIALLPVLVVLIYKKNGVKKLINSIIAFAATAYVVVSPFQYLDANNIMQDAWNKPVGFLSGAFFSSYSEYKFTSVSAFNFWALWPGLGVSDGGGLYVLGWVLFGALAAVVCYFLYKRLDDAGDSFAIFCAFLLFFGFFMLPTRIHERYMFPAMATLALAVPFMKRAVPLYAILTVTLLVNEVAILYYDIIWIQINLFKAQEAGVNLLFPPNFSRYPVVLAVSAVNLVMLGYALLVLRRKWTWLRTGTRNREEKINPSLS